MVVAKGLLLKGLGVCAICAGGATTVALKWGDISSAFSSPISRKKMVWGGLECEEPTEQEGGGCSLKTGEKILVKKADGSHFEVSNLGEGTGKIKVYKAKKEGDDGYNEGFKFLIEDNDINGVGEGNKLEEFESYEVKKGTEDDGADLNGKHYLFRKTDSKTEIKNALGLPWALPEGETEDHTKITDEQLKTIKFKGGAATITGENVTLTITKEATKTEYPLGYKFTFKTTSETAATLTIGSEAIKIKNVSPIDYDFKIKRNGSSLSLEKAWSLETFTEKIGLVKGSEGDYWDVGEKGLNVKQGDSTKKDKKTKKDGSTGKIKVYEGQTEYNGGFKFTIEEGDLILKDSDTSDITLEEFQSYEIVKEDEKWYLSKKEEAKDGIKRALGISCEFPTGQDYCSLTIQNIKTIKFKEGDATLSGGNVTLTVSPDTSKEEYPYGFKFSFKNTDGRDAILKTGKETLTLKQNSPVEFKIKKEGSSISLEKAWTLEELTKKVGLVKQKDGFWNVESTGLNIKQDSAKHTNKTRKTGNDDGKGKVRVYEGQAGYNEGFKFILEDGDITLKNNGSSEITLGQFQGYEIVKEDGKWYLSKKEGDEVRIKELLGFTNGNCVFPTSNTSAKCDLTKENIKTIKFDGAEDKSATVTGTPKLTISKETGRIDFPLGYKFVFSSESNSTITIPTSTPYIIRDGLSIDYKIKRNEKNKSLLSLERAWDPNVLMVKGVFFEKGSKDNEWVAKTVTVNIQQDSKKTTSARADTNSNNAKIRLYEGVPGYNQGMKFMVEDGDTSFSEGGDIKKLTKYETYEASKDGNDWYLVRKQKAEESIRELLGLPKECSMPTQQNESPTCDLDDSKLKAVKFEGKGNGELKITGSGSVTIKISKESNESEYPKGFKFTFNSDSKSFTIPQGSSASITVNNSNTEFKIKETGNTLTLEKK